MGYLIIGASGFVGNALARSLTSAGEEVRGTYLSRPRADATLSLDVRDADATAALLTRLRPRPRVVVLAAPSRAPPPGGGWAAAVGSLAAVAREVGARLVMFSSERVFGDAAGLRTETDEPHPADETGRGELAAERAALDACEATLVIRTSAVFGWDRRSDNLATAVADRLQAGEPLLIDDDRAITPTAVGYLAEASVRLAEAGQAGLVHVTNGEQITPLELARRLARAFGLDPGMIRLAEGAREDVSAARAGLCADRLVSLLGTRPPGLDVCVRGVRRDWMADTRSVRQPEGSPAAELLRAEILDKVRQYHELANSGHQPFRPFETRVNYAGRVYGSEEMVNLVDSALSFWLTLGPYGDRFEARIREYFGSRDAIMVSSGSAANLTAFLALMSSKLERPIRPGDEVITPAVTFPTTLAPIVHSGAVPVFVDCEIGTYNVDPALLGGALSDRTRAIMIPHTLGNPCDMDVVMRVAREHQLLVIEDTCDALGSTFRGQLVGTFGDLATLSFYPAHHVTTGEGGCVVANTPRLGRIVRSVRDWGRDCWCAPGEDNTCARRFGWSSGDLPYGYDHKFTYSNIGYNFKPTDMQAAIGVAQLDRLAGFVARRKRNFARLYEGLRPLQEHLILPTLDPRSDPSWFGFPVTLRPGWSRGALVHWLEKANIETRMIFGGNILRQPAYRDIPHRIAGGLERTDQAMAQSFFLGVYPGLGDDALDFIIERFHAFFAR